VTKPGNSDPAEPGADKPAEATPADDTTSSLAPDPVEPEPAEAEPAKAEPADTEPEKAEPEAKAASEAKPKPRTRPARPKAGKAPRIRDDEPVMPTAAEAAMRAQAKRRFEEPPPRTLRLSFYFFIASGLIWLASMVLSLYYKQDFIDAQIEASKDTDLTPEQIANGITQLLWIVTIAAVTFTVFLGLFGYKATEGTRRARTLVTIFGTVLVLFQLLFNGTPPAILSAMFCLVGLGLLWSPSARRYFPPRELR